jgi:hypothetical protein
LKLSLVIQRWGNQMLIVVQLTVRLVFMVVFTTAHKDFGAAVVHSPKGV